MEGVVEVEEQALRMDAPKQVELRVTGLNERLARYVPPRDTWTAAEEAALGPTDLFQVSVDEAQAMQLKVIKYAFAHHFNDNGFYRQYCTMWDVSPGDIETVDGLLRIPLIPDLTYKQYPEGKEFARWIENVVLVSCQEW